MRSTSRLTRLLTWPLCAALLAACSSSSGDDTPPREAALAAIDWTRMKATVDVLADDALGGRIPGSPGHAAAREHLLTELDALGLEPFGDDGTYLQTFEGAGTTDRHMLDADGAVVPSVKATGYNVVAVLRGADDALADEYVVLMGHYDHIGVEADGDVFNGAFDNAGGAAALLELARVMTSHEVAPGRSIVFLWSDDEESGLSGAEHWIENPPVPKERIVAGISADPVGRGVLPDYAPIVLMGLERSPELAEVFRDTIPLADTTVAFLHRDVIIGFASDQDTFHRAGVPGVWFVTPGMSFYHTVKDTAETLDYRVMQSATRYLLRATLAVADAPGPFSYRDAPAIDAGDVANTRPLLAGLLGSSALTADERAQVESHLAAVDQIIADGNLSSVDDDPTSFFLPIVLFTAFQLPAAHPGTIPPPTP